MCSFTHTHSLPLSLSLSLSLTLSHALAPALPNRLPPSTPHLPPRTPQRPPPRGFGRIIHSADQITVENGEFEIVPWPVQGHRPLDPDTGDEAGTTEGPFEVHWHGDFYYGTNLAIASSNYHYLDGLGAIPEKASHTPTPPPPPPPVAIAMAIAMARIHQRTPTRSTSG